MNTVSEDKDGPRAEASRRTTHSADGGAYTSDDGGVGRLIEQRQKKAEELRSMGFNPYASGFRPTATARLILERFADATPPETPSKEITLLSEERFAVAGRIVEHRSFGKAAFIKIADRSARIQVYVRKDQVGQDAYAAFKKCEPWDFVGIVGAAFFTKTGELTLLADSVLVLTKTVRPPPEKWSGLRNLETRYRQRYVDLVANPAVADVFRTRARIVREIRRYLDQMDFLEVETPILHPTLGGAAARPFSTHHNALDMPLYLRVAPELYLKRLLVGGFERVYEVGRNFRNEGLSRFHNPEFTMLEFYMAYATSEDLIEMTEDLLSQLVEQVTGGTQIQYQGQQIDFQRPWTRITLSDAVIHATSAFSQPLTPEIVSQPAALDEWLHTSGLSAQDDELGKSLREGQSVGHRLGALFDGLAEARLPQDRPVFVTEYPAEVSPLSRRNDNNPAFVDRFELFVAGKEIANAFSELNDPVDQRERFRRQLEARKGGDAEAMEYDEDYCRALEYGMPPAGGEGIGIDRLTMVLCDQPSIRDVVLFPHMRPEAL